MDAIMQAILAELKGIRAALEPRTGTAGVATVQPAATMADPFATTAAAPVTQPAPANVTDQQILDLIQPHIGNPVIKEALGVAMRGMGIAGLPEAQAHQYGALYQAFQGVIQQHTGVQAVQPQAAAASASII